MNSSPIAFGFLYPKSKIANPKSISDEMVVLERLSFACLQDRKELRLVEGALVLHCEGVGACAVDEDAGVDHVTVRIHVGFDVDLALGGQVRDGRRHLLEADGRVVWVLCRIGSVADLIPSRPAAAVADADLHPFTLFCKNGDAFAAL